MSEFDTFYSKMWGTRWPYLRSSLFQRENQVARYNIFSGLLAQETIEFQKISLLGLQNIFACTDQLRKVIPRSENELLSFYIMDPASIWIAEQLSVQSGNQVLDMCAAPGGKTLCLIEKISDEGQLIANDSSPGRRDRLIKVIQQYVPRNIRERVRVSGKVGGLFAKSHEEQFDRILVDAPCSGERHLINNDSELKKWSPKRTERLAQEQYSLLVAALHACKPGGEIIYSTCSLSNIENDGVINMLLQKKSKWFRDACVEIKILDLPEGAERTQHGVYFLPDALGIGPLFACSLRKLTSLS